jgi:hypothetical protein
LIVSDEVVDWRGAGAGYVPGRELPANPGGEQLCRRNR